MRNRRYVSKKGTISKINHLYLSHINESVNFILLIC